jgi:protein-disulfide isomerase
MPVFGVAFFAALGLAAVVPRLRRALVPLALAGGLGALVLLALQAFAVHAFCRFCLVADASLLVAAGSAASVSFDGPPRPRLALSGGLTLAALALPALIVARAPAPPPPSVTLAASAATSAAASAATPLPAAVAREQRPGVLTIVEFTDFECPYCRKLHVALEEALHGLEARVRIVRKMMPLTQVHPHALEAALAWCCADQAGKGDAMAEALVHADDLGREANVALASTVGLDAVAFRACVADPATRARVDADVSDADASGVAGRLPTYWVGKTLYRGAHDAAFLRRCVEDALAD